MKNWFAFLLLAICAVLLYKFLYAISKRIYALIKIHSLKKLADAKITYVRPPFLSFLFTSAKPDVSVRIGDTVYLLRFLSGVSGRYYMHFASENYLVRFTRSRFHLGGRLKIGKRYRVTEYSGYVTTDNHSVKILPSLEMGENLSSTAENGDFSYSNNEIKTVPVLLLNPTPCELSYVTKEKTSIKVAFTGDEVFGQKIFTASTFVTFAEREARRECDEGDYEFSWED